jgi:ankyrin repeat protein
VGCDIDFRAGVKLLLSEGASINATTGLHGFTPLLTAAQFGFAKLVRILLSHGASIDLTENEGSTPLSSQPKRDTPRREPVAGGRGKCRPIEA